MKNLLALVVFFGASFQLVTAQEIKFASEEINYGTIEKGTDGIREFKFTNTGDAPLVIQGAVSSCGCAVPDYPKKPIMPGESNIIRVKYDTQRLGRFGKYVITLTTNDKNNTTSRLTIFGEVKPKAPTTPNNDKGFMN